MVCVEIQIPTFHLCSGQSVNAFFYFYTENISGDLLPSLLVIGHNRSNVECTVSDQILHCGGTAIFCLTSVKTFTAKWHLASFYAIEDLSIIGLSLLFFIVVIRSAEWLMQQGSQKPDWLNEFRPSGLHHLACFGDMEISQLCFKIYLCSASLPQGTQRRLWFSTTQKKTKNYWAAVPSPRSN